MSDGQTASEQARFGQYPLSVASGRSLSTEAGTMDLPDLEALSLEAARQLVRDLHLKLIECRKSQERYRTVVEDQTEVISRFRSDGLFTFVNSVYCRFFGKPSHELLGKQWQPMAVPDDVPGIEAQLRRLSPTNPVVMIENRVYAGSGQVHWMQFVNRAFFDAEGRLEEIQSVGRDITERKRAEELVRERDEFTQAILNSVSSHIAVVDPNGVIMAVNDPWRRFAIENGTEPGRPARNTEVGVNYLQICRESRGESSEGAMTAHDGISHAAQVGRRH